MPTSAIKRWCCVLLVGLWLPGYRAAAQADRRPQLAILTDIGGDPDDQQSMIRLMVYANEFRIQALIASAAGTPGELNQSLTRPDLIHEIVSAYEQVLPKLQRHATGWPTADTLRRRIKSGNRLRGLEHVGVEHDSEGSQEIIRLVDASQPEDPLNLAIWGGQTDLAQALFRVRQDRSPEQVVEFCGRLRVYDIADQDGLAQWIQQGFPRLRYILSRAPRGADKREATFRGMYLTGDESLTSRQWIEEHVRQTGPLGALYPVKTWTAPNEHGCLKEGDTPSWFFFLPRGGNNPQDPTQPGWGGRFQQVSEQGYRDLPQRDGRDPRHTVSRWRPEFQADFALRMSWCR